MKLFFRSLASVLVVGLSFGFLSSCGESGGTLVFRDDGGGDEVVEVDLTQQLTFNPSDVTVSPGTTVRWINVVGTFNTVTPDGHREWVSATLTDAGATFEHTFETAGVFPYFSEPNREQGMTGVVRVQ